MRFLPVVRTLESKSDIDDSISSSGGGIGLSLKTSLLIA